MHFLLFFNRLIVFFLLATAKPFSRAFHWGNTERTLREHHSKTASGYWLLIFRHCNSRRQIFSSSMIALATTSLAALLAVMLEEMLDCFSNKSACAAADWLSSASHKSINDNCLIVLEFFKLLLAYKVVFELSCFPLLSKGSGCRNARFWWKKYAFIEERSVSIKGRFFPSKPAGLDLAEWSVTERFGAAASYLCSEKTISTYSKTKNFALCK